MSARARGRLAPSPTGVLHLGNARSCLLAWLDARSRGGEILLRIEDLDGPRVRAGAEAEALEDLRWLGLDWDGTLLRQSERAAIYDAALQSLAVEGLAYPCVCTRRDAELASSAPHAGEDGPPYPGTCSGRWSSSAAAQAASGRAACWRFRVPEAGTAEERVSFVDRVRGPCAYAAAELGDFVIRKRDGLAAYQLAVVVDDLAQGVNEVGRGDDLLPSTARQLLLHRALGPEPPSYAHLPLVIGADGRRLAKRHGDTSLGRFRAEGVAPEQIVGWLAAVSGLSERPAPTTPAALLKDFSLDRVPRSAVIWRGDFDG